MSSRISQRLFMDGCLLYIPLILQLCRNTSSRQGRTVLYEYWMRDKTADFKTRQNSGFSKRDKTADFQNGIK